MKLSSENLFDENQIYVWLISLNAIIRNEFKLNKWKERNKWGWWHLTENSIFGYIIAFCFNQYNEFKSISEKVHFLFVLQTIYAICQYLSKIVNSTRAIKWFTITQIFVSLFIHTPFFFILVKISFYKMRFTAKMLPQHFLNRKRQNLSVSHICIILILMYCASIEFIHLLLAIGMHCIHFHLVVSLLCVWMRRVNHVWTFAFVIFLLASSKWTHKWNQRTTFCTHTFTLKSKTMKNRMQGFQIKHGSRIRCVKQV